jgi:hypothetical protein
MHCLNQYFLPLSRLVKVNLRVLDPFDIQLLLAVRGSAVTRFITAFTPFTRTPSITTSPGANPADTTGEAGLVSGGAGSLSFTRRL